MFLTEADEMRATLIDRAVDYWVKTFSPGHLKPQCNTIAFLSGLSNISRNELKDSIRRINNGNS